MLSDAIVDAASTRPYAFNVLDVAAIAHERGWLGDRVASTGDGSPLGAWLARAAQLLCPHAPTRDRLAELLSLVFTYDASSVLREPSSHAVLARAGAREVIREVAHHILAAGEIDSDSFKSLIDALKEALPYRGPALFAPIRLALTGKIGAGDLDRVILLLDSGAKLDFAVPVKSARQRILEFCAALD